MYSPLADSPNRWRTRKPTLGFLLPSCGIRLTTLRLGSACRAGCRLAADGARDGGCPRWLPVAGTGVIVLIVAVAVVLGHGGTPAAQLAGRGTAAGTGNGSTAPGPGLQPVITRTAAEQVLARFTSINNQANKLYDNALLATIEGGSPRDGYRHLPHGPGHRPRASQYAAFGPQQAVYYILRQPAGTYPHFFVVKVANADLASPQHVTFTQYLLFAQAAPGAQWKDVIEPNLFSAVRPAPAIAVDAQGYAQQVSMTGNPGVLSTAPGQLQADTISWLDREAAAGADPANTRTSPTCAT